MIHRDLKPANIKLTPSGDVRMLDFGLAKAFEGDRSGDGSLPSMSPTITAGTMAGTLLGVPNHGWDVGRGGERFVTVETSDVDVADRDLTLILDWQPRGPGGESGGGGAVALE